MDLTTPAIVVSVLPHGEHGAIVRALTSDHGLLGGYVRGGRGRRLRPVLGLGNGVSATFRARTETQLPALTVEPTTSRAGLAFDPLAASALDWLCALVSTVVPEAQPVPDIHTRMDALLDAMAQPDALAWAAEIARFELALLADLGFGLDLASCAATGQIHDLAFVSPRSSRAVSQTAGAPYTNRLLPLAPFLIAGSPRGWSDIADALRMTGHFIGRDLIEAGAQRILPARERLAALIERRAIPELAPR